MLLFSLENVGQTFNGIDVFSGVGLKVQAGERIAIVGPNGIGKSSLLRIIGGIDEPARGSIKFHSPASCGLLTQSFPDRNYSTVRSALEKAAPETGDHSRLGEALKKYKFAGREDQAVVNLSGGEKTRLQLAQIWLAGADLLLLDEPTNHLDVQSLVWLEHYINDYRGTIVLVSHDRYFLDRTVQRVIELRKDGAVSYSGNYSVYHKTKQEQRLRDEQKFLEQEKRMRNLHEAIKEQEVWAGKAHRRAASKAAAMGCKKGGKVYYRARAKKLESRVKSNIKRLERMEKEPIDHPKKERSIHLSFNAARRAGSVILTGEGISKAFDQRLLFSNSQFALQYGEKAALVGENGSGKTTLLRILYGLELPDGGQLWKSPSLRLGYLEQELRFSDQNHNVLEEVAAVCSDRGRVRNLLADLLFTGEEVFKPCTVLSMGEQVRVALAKLLLGNYDLLLMDEPANYLDLPGREKLEDALEAYGGSLILVSHDRYLMERVAHTIWSIERGRVEVCPGGYSDFAAKRFVDRPEYSNNETERLELEVKKARLISELSLLDRKRNPAEYLRIEKEFLDTIRKLRK